MVGQGLVVFDLGNRTANHRQTYGFPKINNNSIRLGYCAAHEQKPSSMRSKPEACQHRFCLPIAKFYTIQILLGLIFIRRQRLESPRASELLSILLLSIFLEFRSRAADALNFFFR